jgi:phosphotriesterase-related protein
MGHAIVDALEAAGARPERIALAHMDRNPDAEIHAEIAARGVTLEYDTMGRTKYHPDSVVLDLIEAVVAAGHQDRIVIGLDLGTRDYHRAYGGGPGLRYLMTDFVPRLRRRLGEDATRRILVENPARFYAVPGGRTALAAGPGRAVAASGAAAAAAATGAATARGAGAADGAAADAPGGRRA